MAALGRRLATMASAFSSRKTCWTAFSEPSLCRRYSSSARPQSLRKCASAAEALLDDEADDVPLKVEMAPLVLQRRVVVYDGVCHLCHSGSFSLLFVNTAISSVIYCFGDAYQCVV